MRENFEVLMEAIANFEKKYGDSETFSFQERVADRHFVEELLIGLIRARPLARSSKTDAQRWHAAYVAIYGHSPDTAPQKSDDYNDLQRMAVDRSYQEHDSSAGAASRIDSVSALAGKYACGDEAKKRRLRTKFPAFYENYKLRDDEKDAHVESIRRIGLEVIEDILKKFGVPFYAYD